MPAYVDCVRHGAHHAALHRAPGLLNGWLVVLLPAGESADVSLARVAGTRHRAHTAPVAGCELCQLEQANRHRTAEPVGDELHTGPLEHRTEQRPTGLPLPGPGHYWALANQRTTRTDREPPPRRVAGGAGLLDAIWTGSRLARARRNHIAADRQSPVPLTDGFTFLDLNDGEAWMSATWYSLNAAGTDSPMNAVKLDTGGLYIDTTDGGASTVLVNHDGTGPYYDATGPAGTSSLAGVESGGSRAFLDDESTVSPLTSALMGVDGTGPYYDLAGAANVSVLSVELGQPTLTY